MIPVEVTLAAADEVTAVVCPEGRTHNKTFPAEVEIVPGPSFTGVIGLIGGLNIGSPVKAGPGITGSCAVATETIGFIDEELYNDTSQRSRPRPVFTTMTCKVHQTSYSSVNHKYAFSSISSELTVLRQ